MVNRERLRELRLEHGWSQAELARQGGINQSHYCQIEKGGRNPSPKMLLRLANLLGTTVKDLVDDSGTA